MDRELKRDSKEDTHRTIDASFKHFLSKFKPIQKEIVRGNVLSIREKEHLSRAIFGSLLGEKKSKYDKKVPAIFNALTTNPSWDELKEIVNSNEVLAGYATYYLLKAINDQFDNPKSAINKVLQMIMDEIKKLFGRKINRKLSLDILNSENVAETLASENIENLADKVQELNNFKSETIANAKQEIKNSMNALISDLLDELRRLSETLSLISALVLGRYWDLSPGFIKSIYFENLLLLAKIMTNIKDLRELIEILGRLEFSMRKEKKLAPSVSSEIYEIRLSGDIERTIPSELVKLRHKKLKMLFYAKMIERGLLTYYLRGKMPFEKRMGEKRGPVITAIDTSGSMHGEPELLAKSVALAVILLAAKQKRKVYLILFSGPRDLEELEFIKGKTSLESLLRFLSISFGGGTDFNTPIKHIINLLNKQEYEKADILFLTDGLSNISEYVMDDLNRIKNAKKARVFTVIVGNDNLAGAKDFSDEAFYIMRSDYSLTPKLFKIL